MKEIISRICELQPLYSASNTAEMQERGNLIRRDLANAIRDHLPLLAAVVDRSVSDLAVEGSDGIGRKTEAPWVRVFSKHMSPSPREGFYFVIHFSADGSAVFFTVGCRSTIWQDGDLHPVPESELAQRTAWARSVVDGRWGTLAPFTDQISLGARARLPATFERATAFAHRVPKSEFENADFVDLLRLALERLSEIYLAQKAGRDVSPGEMDASEVRDIANPLRNPAGRQGFGLSSAERRAVELRAMELAIKHLQTLGFTCTDTSANLPFDVLAKAGERALKIEVKGTTSDFCESILMTRNEVSLHLQEKGQTGLVIVSKIRLHNRGDCPTADGGELEAMVPWDIEQWSADPIAFQLSRPR